MEERRDSVEQSAPSGASVATTGGGLVRAGSLLGTDDHGQGKEVVLRLEYIGNRTAKVLLRLVTFALVGALALFIWETKHKFDGVSYSLTISNTQQIVNVSVASGGLAGLLAVGAALSSGILQARRQGKHWSRRRKQLVVLTSVEMLVQTINLVALMVPNAYILANPCSWFSYPVHWSAFVQWTCWVTLALLWLVQAHNLLPLDGSEGIWSWMLGMRWGRLAKKDRMVADLPFWFHLPKVVVFWLPTEILVVLFTLWVCGIIGPFESSYYSPEFCSYLKADLPYVSDFFDNLCFMGTTGLVLNIIFMALFNLQLVLYMVLCMVASRKLQRLPYRKFRVANIEVRVQFRTKLAAMGFSIVCILVLLYADSSYCDSYTLVWLGITPMQLAVTAIVAVNGILNCPITPTQEQIDVHDWQQDFAWTENEVPAKLAQRRVADPAIFCFETAIRTLFWSRMIYKHGQVEEAKLKIETAMGLFGLSRYLVLWERKRDSKCILAYGSNTIVIAFRGTASMANAISDIQVWRSVHPPVRGSLLLGTRPLVHTGFLQSWLAGGLDQTVLSKLREILTGSAGEGGSPSAGAADGGGDASSGAKSTAVGSSAEDVASAAEDVASAAAEELRGGSWRRFGRSGSGSGKVGVWQSSGSMPAAAADPPEGSASGALEQQASCAGPGGGGGPWRVFCTGHSLGGALAMLCAYDVAQLLKELGGPAVATVSCYTFGAPRPGNRAFAEDFIQQVQDSFDVFHHNDAVAVEGKLGCMYKRAAHRVILTQTRDIIVRPTHIEASMQRGPASSVAAHRLSNYGRSLGGILASQCRKGTLGPGQLKALRSLEEVLAATADLDFSDLSKEVLARMAGGNLPGKTSLNKPDGSRSRWSVDSEAQA